MLKIRAEQVAALGRASRDRFVASLTETFTRCYPGEAPGEDVQALVTLGVHRAEGHGYTREREVALYVNVMFMLGAFFDEDPQVPWAGAELDLDLGGAPLERISRVHDMALDNLGRTMGEEGEHLVRACLRARKHAFDGAGNAAECLRTCATLFPEKAAHQGDAANHSYAAQAFTLARGAGLGARGTQAYVVCGFFLGAGFARDPLHRWAARAEGWDDASFLSAARQRLDTAIEQMRRG
jgi:hypothetical protein